MADSTISGNATSNGLAVTGVGGDGGSGGGIYNANSLTVTGSTISSNTTFSGNGASFGGGIINGPPTGQALTLRNVTLAGNTTDSNGGGLYQYGGALDIGNSLLTGNTAPSGTDYFYFGGTRTDAGHNFVPSSVGQSWTAPGDIYGNTATVVAPLADNGGTTALPDGTHPKTHALLTSCTPANRCLINNGDAVLCAASPVNKVDERGSPRASPGGCDIGAFEVQPNALPAPRPTVPPAGQPAPAPLPRMPAPPVGANTPTPRPVPLSR